jgi:hypothetical protein
MDPPTLMAVTAAEQREFDRLRNGFWLRRRHSSYRDPSSEVVMSSDLSPRPIPGEWYLGVRCSQCDEMVLYAPDLSRGHGALGFLEADDIVQEACVAGHQTSFRLYELHRFQWRPRYSA